MVASGVLWGRWWQALLKPRRFAERWSEVAHALLLNQANTCVCQRFDVLAASFMKMMHVAHGAMSSGSYWNVGVFCCPHLRVRSGDSRLLRNWVTLRISTAVICQKTLIFKIYVFLHLPVIGVLKVTGGRKSEMFWQHEIKLTLTSVSELMIKKAVTRNCTQYSFTWVFLTFVHVVFKFVSCVLLLV